MRPEPAAVASQPLDLALRPAGARRVELERHLRTHEPADAPREVADGDLVVRADVRRGAGARGAVGDRQESRHGVLYEGEVTGGLEIAEAEPHAAAEQLRHDRRDDRAGGLPRAVRVERAHEADVEAEGAVEAQRQLIGADLAGRVGGLRVGGMGLVDRHVPRRPVRLAGRRDQHALDAGVARRLEDVVRPLDVRPDVAQRRDVGVWDADQRRQMEDGVAAAHGAGDRVEIAHVAGDDLHLRADEGVVGMEVGPIVDHLLEEARRADRRMRDAHTFTQVWDDSGRTITILERMTTLVRS